MIKFIFTEQMYQIVLFGFLSLTDFLTLTLTISALFVAIAIPSAQKKNEKRKNTIHLHEKYWSIENYIAVLSPTFRIALRWEHLDEKSKIIYRDIVVSGWVRAELKSKERIEKYCGKNARNRINRDCHFIDEISETSLTEHEALTLLLYTWSELYVYYQENLVDRQLFRKLFRKAFEYKHVFLLDLAKSIKNKLSENDIKPQWIDEIEGLNRILLVDNT